MVETGQVAAVEQMTYQGRGTAAAVELMTFARLRAVNRGGTQRADFHVLAVVDGGRGEVSVDFARHRLTRRSAVWITPGAVHRWDDLTRLAGRLVLFVPTAPVTAATRELAAAPGSPVPWTVPTAEWALVGLALDHLHAECDAATAGAPSEIPQVLLSALLGRLRPPRAQMPPGGDVFRAFAAAVEAGYREHHDVGHYARVLGYSPRTLSRAVHRTTGTTAKTYITERLVLEAERLLAHDRLSAARCASHLGFADPSNFSAFFRQATGERPGAWAQTHADPISR